MSKAKYPIELVNRDGFTITGILTLEIAIPKSLEPALEFAGVLRVERENLVNQKLAEVAQLLGYDPDGTFG
jgi:hypothetical protein